MYSSTTKPPIIGFVFLTLLTFDLCRAVSLDIHGDDTAAVLSRDVRSYLDSKISEFEDTLQKTFTGHPSRQRRSPPPGPPEDEPELSWEIESLSKIDYNGSTVIEHFYVEETSYVIIGKSQGDDGGYNAKAFIFKYDEGTSAFVPIGSSISTSGLADIAAHLVRGYVYIAVANQQFAGDQYNGMSNIYRFDHNTNTTSFFMQLFTKGATDMEFFDYDGDVYLAVANQRSDLYARYRVNVEIYQFLYTNFDFVTSTETYGASSIETFEYDEVLYLTVAQYIDNDGNYDVGTNVYYFDTGASTLNLVQTLSTSGAIHVEAMLVNGHQFLAVANHLLDNGRTQSYDTTSAIYWWEGNQFWEYQTIDTHGASHIEYIPVTDFHLIAVVNTESADRNVVLYQYDEDDSGDWIETSERTQAFDFNDFVDTIAMTTIVIGDDMFVGLANNISYTSSITDTNFFKFALVNETLGPAPVVLRPHKSCINDIVADIEVQNEDLSNLTLVVSQSLSKTLDQNITASIVIEGNVTFATLTVNQTINISDEFSYSVDPVLEANINTGLQTSTTLKSDIETNAVTIVGSQSITDHKTFTQDVHVSTETEGDVSSEDGYINDKIRWTELNDTVLRLTGDQVLGGDETLFTTDVILQDDLTVELLVNDLDIPDNIMTLADDQTSTGQLTFEGQVTFDSDVLVDGTVNELDTDNIISTIRNHTIAGDKKLDGDLDVPNIIIDDTFTVDGVDVSVFEPQVIRLSSGGTMSDAVTFNGSTTFADVDITNNEIDGVDIKTLIADLVFVDTYQVITGVKNFTQDIMHLNGNLTVTGYINDEDLSEVIVTLSGEQTIQTDIKLQNTMTVSGHVLMGNEVNKVDLDEESLLDHSDQVITGKVNFTNDVTARSNINMEDSATISGIDISNLDDTSVKISGDFDISGEKTFENQISVTGDITVQGLANDLNITYLYEDCLSLTQPQTFDLATTFGGNITLNGDVAVIVIDGLDMSNFTLLDSDDTIYGHKTFLKATTMQGNLNVTGNVNDKSIADLDTKILKNINTQTLSGKLMFASDLYASDDIAAEYVNLYNLTDDFVALARDQNVWATKTFTTNSVTVNGEIFGKTMTFADGTINSIDVAQIVDDAVLNGTDGTMAGSKTFAKIIVNGDLDIEGNINNVDLATFDSTAVKLDGTQTISGNITFDSDIHLGANADITGTMNGVDIGVRGPLVVLKDTNGTISGAKQFDSNVVMQSDLDVDGLVNDVDIETIEATYLSKSQVQTISGVKNFTNNIHLENLTLTNSALLDTVNTASLALIDANETFTVAIEFDNDMEVTGDATVGANVDGVDIVNLNNTAVYITGPAQTVDGVKTFHSLELESNITMLDEATVNDVDVSEIAEVSVKISGNQTINLATIFEDSVEVDGNLESYEELGPYNLRNLIADAVFFNTTMPIGGDKTFTEVISINNFDIDADLDVDVIQGTQILVELLDQTITMSDNQTIEGNVTFTQTVDLQGDLDITGRLNRVVFPQNAVLVYGDQTINPPQTFKDGFEIDGNLTIDGVIDSVDVDDLEAIRVSLSEDQVIEGLWEIRDDVDVTGNISVTGIVNDMVVRNQLVTLTDVQTIMGEKTFLGNITVQGDIECAEVNLENMVEFQSDMVLHEGDFTLTADKTFSASLTLGCKTVRGLVDNVNVTELPQNSADTNVFQDNWIFALNESVQAQCPYVMALQNTYEGQPLVLDHWIDWQKLDVTAGSYIDTIPYENGSLLVVAETSDTPFHKCIETSLYRCPVTVTEPCWSMNSTLGSASSANMFSFSDDQTFIVLTSSGQAELCQGEAGYVTATRVVTVEDREFNVTVEAENAVDSTMFELDGNIYLVIINSMDSANNPTTSSTVFKYNSGTTNFDVHQQVTTIGGKAVTFLEHDGKAWLAWANGEGQVNSVIAEWNSGTQQFVPSKNIGTNYASDVISFVVDDVAYMAFANEKSVSRFGVDACNKPVVIYRYDGSDWVKIQSIVAECIIDLDVFAVDDIVYLVFISATLETNNVLIYQWSGLSLFTPYQTLTLEDAIQAHVFSHVGGLYMSITRPVMCPFADEHAGGPQILNAVIKGQKSDSTFTFWN